MAFSQRCTASQSPPLTWGTTIPQGLSLRCSAVLTSWVTVAPVQGHTLPWSALPALRDCCQCLCILLQCSCHWFTSHHRDEVALGLHPCFRLRPWGAQGSPMLWHSCSACLSLGHPVCRMETPSCIGTRGHLPRGGVRPWSSMHRKGLTPSHNCCEEVQNLSHSHSPQHHAWSGLGGGCAHVTAVPAGLLCLSKAEGCNSRHTVKQSIHIHPV